MHISSDIHAGSEGCFYFLLYRNEISKQTKKVVIYSQISNLPLISLVNISTSVNETEFAGRELVDCMNPVTLRSISGYVTHWLTEAGFSGPDYAYYLMSTVESKYRIYSYIRLH